MDRIDREVRNLVYQSFAATGHPPHRDAVSMLTGSDENALASLRRLQEAHAIVLDDDDSIRMALPFSAVPTGFAVDSGGVRYDANCAWDALAVPVVLHRDATIEATWADTGEPVRLTVQEGTLSPTDGFVHFTVPARDWWDDIVFT